MNIRKYYISESLNTRRKDKINKVKYLIVTSSNIPGADCLKNRLKIEMNKNIDNEYSCHYIIDLNGNILQIIPEEECSICSNVIDYDSCSISIMLCVGYNNYYSEMEIKRLKELINDIQERHGLTDDSIIFENDINGSRRPYILCDERIKLV